MEQIGSRGGDTTTSVCPPVPVHGISSQVAYFAGSRPSFPVGHVCLQIVGQGGREVFCGCGAYSMA